MRRDMLCCVVVAAALFGCAPPAVAAEGATETVSEANINLAPAPVYEPAKTKVAVLPLVNALGREDSEIKGSCDRGAERLRSTFAERLFVALESKAVAEAVKALGVDLGDSEERTKDTFQKIGEAAGADLVVCTVLNDYGVRQGRKRAGEAKIELKVYGTREKAYRVRATQAGNKTQSMGPMGSFEKSRDLRWQALEDALNKALKDFLKPYPVTKKPEKPGAGGQSGTGGASGEAPPRG